MKTLLIFIDHPQMGRGKRSDISVDGDMIVLQNSTPNWHWNLGIPRNGSAF
jgi:hypothetical protein